MALCIGLGDLGRGYWREKKKNQTHIKIGGPLTSCTVTTASSAWEGRWVRKDAAATWRSGANLRAPCSASVNFKAISFIAGAIDWNPGSRWAG